MTNANSSNMTPSHTALLSGPQQKRRYNTDDERIFLAQQAADAQTAIQHTVADIQVTAREVANIHWWTQQYPWYAVVQRQYSDLLSRPLSWHPPTTACNQTHPSRGR